MSEFVLDRVQEFIDRTLEAEQARRRPSRILVDFLNELNSFILVASIAEDDGEEE